MDLIAVAPLALLVLTLASFISWIAAEQRGGPFRRTMLGLITILLCTADAWIFSGFVQYQKNRQYRPAMRGLAELANRGDFQGVRSILQVYERELANGISESDAIGNVRQSVLAASNTNR